MLHARLLPEEISMDELIRKAEELGRLLADHERFQALMSARDAVRADADARQLLRDYEAQVQKIQRLAVEKQPIEVSDKHRLSDLERQVASNDRVKALTRAQADFSELMSRINRAIYDRIAPRDTQPDSSGKGAAQQ
jgi:cell fate (sporulation/competence/biofilm development) regulator YlbF (YheA/YmcA/DUF963 family)